MKVMDMAIWQQFQVEGAFIKLKFPAGCHHHAVTQQTCLTFTPMLIQMWLRGLLVFVTTTTDRNVQWRRARSCVSLMNMAKGIQMYSKWMNFNKENKRQRRVNLAFWLCSGTVNWLVEYKTVRLLSMTKRKTYVHGILCILLFLLSYKTT